VCGKAENLEEKKVLKVPKKLKLLELIFFGDSAGLFLLGC
jgi:hypothetical protein